MIRYDRYTNNKQACKQANKQTNERTVFLRFTVFLITEM